MSDSPLVLLATFQGLPDGEPAHEVLDDALASRGVRSAWASWDDPDVDWSAADLVAVRATWDYTERREEFLLWTRRVQQATRLLNGTEVFAANTDKSYLARMFEASRLGSTDVAVVPTLLVDDLQHLAAARDRLGDLVVKPRVGAGGEGVVVVRRERMLERIDLSRPLVAQPLVESVLTEGEISVFVLGGRAVSLVRKLPAAGEIRVHEHLGGTYRAEPLTDDLADVAGKAYEAACALTGARLDYARVDLLHWGGSWRVSELELVEPSLYLDVVPGNGPVFADLVVDRLGSMARTGHSV